MYAKEVIFMAINIEKLKKEVLDTREKSNLTDFKDIVAVYLGTEPKDYFKKVKDSSGKNVTDNDGNPIREENSSGLTYTFSEVGTSNIIKIVLPKKYNLELLDVFKLSGQGYDIRQSSLVFIQENGSISRYE